MDEPRLGILLGPGGHGGKIVTDADERRTMAECTCLWSNTAEDSRIYMADPACPVHGEIAAWQAKKAAALAALVDPADDPANEKVYEETGGPC